MLPCACFQKPLQVLCSFSTESLCGTVLLFCHRSLCLQSAFLPSLILISLRWWFIVGLDRNAVLSLHFCGGSCLCQTKCWCQPGTGMACCTASRIPTECQPDELHLRGIFSELKQLIACQSCLLIQLQLQLVMLRLWRLSHLSHVQRNSTSLRNSNGMQNFH